MPFNNPKKPKILRTQLDEQTHREFKAIAAINGVTMAELIEKLIKEEIKKTKR